MWQCQSQNVFYDPNALYSERGLKRPVRVLNAQWASGAPLLCLATASQVTLVAGPGMQSHLRPVGATSKTSGSQQAAGPTCRSAPAPPGKPSGLQPQRLAQPSAAPSSLPTRAGPCPPPPHSLPPHPPEPHGRSQPTSKFLTAPSLSRKGKDKKKERDHDITGRFIWVCLFACWLD